MDWIQALFLGLVQGITEFLPISSSGHLVLSQHLLNIKESGILIEVALHFGTLIAIIIYYYNNLVDLSKDFVYNRQNSRSYILKIVIATLPAIVVGLFLQDIIEEYFTINVIKITFLLTGIILMSTLFYSNNKNSNISIKKAIIIGLMQALAILPGISRSGITISIAMLLGIKKEESARFSFYLAIPILSGAVLLQIYKINNMISINYFPLIIGIISSALTGYMVIGWLLSVIYRGKFWLFSIYCIMLSIITIIIF
tara:strand:- start:281 stop:1048 length:768 start_codon:yes stop_codon:yes gene_type:complete